MKHSNAPGASTTNGPKVALVTGASRGIGAAIARRLAADGAIVVINYRTSENEAEAVCAEIQATGGVSVTEQADVTRLDDVRAMMKRIRGNYGRLDWLVNNAGYADDGMLLLTSHERWWSTFNDNVAAVVNVTRLALPLLLAQKDAAIINISSISGIRGVEGQTAYSAAKAAIIGFTKALSRELAGKISINCVAPGPIETEMYEKVTEERRRARLAILPLRRMGRPEEVAELVALLLSGRSAFIYGQVLAIDGGATI